jgi:hypothetical protein
MNSSTARDTHTAKAAQTLAAERGRPDAGLRFTGGSFAARKAAGAFA